MHPRTVYTVLEETAAAFGDRPALHQPDRNGYRSYTWAEYVSAAREIAAGLRTLGIAKGDIVALDSETRAEFYLADMGIMAAGAVAAALYTSYPAADRARTLRSCDAKAVFVDKPDSLAKLREAADVRLEWILLDGEADDAVSLDELRRRGRQALEADPGLLARLRSETAPEDPAILYLTSGATGEPKMAVVNHGAIVANIDMGPSVLDLGPEDSMLAFLPSAHITQRLVVELLPIRCGVPVWFSESLMRLPQEIAGVKPTVFVAPPRMWERVHTSIVTELRRRPAAARKLFQAALRLGLEGARLRQEGRRLPLPKRALLGLADRHMFARVRARFGGRMRVCASGSAPMGKDLAAFYLAIGLRLIEGYGLTEGGVLTMNPLDRPKAGSIGRPLPGVEVRIADDGELLARSPTLFSGYYKDPDATSQTLKDGWLHTGDTAETDREGYLYITGRKKELIVSSTGRKIYPSRIEALFHLEPIVSQVLLVGDRLPYVAALLTINTAVAEDLSGMERWRGRPAAEVAAAPPVVAEAKKAIARVNRSLAPFEQIRRYRILDREFSIERGELTATMKVRRARALENFRAEAAELYAGRE